MYAESDPRLFTLTREGPTSRRVPGACSTLDYVPPRTITSLLRYLITSSSAPSAHTGASATLLFSWGSFTVPITPPGVPQKRMLGENPSRSSLVPGPGSSRTTRHSPLATSPYLLQNHILAPWPELKHMESNPYTKTLGWGWALLTTRYPLLTAPRSFVPLHRRAHGARIRGSAETVPLLPVSKPVEQHTGLRRGG